MIIVNIINFSAPITLYVYKHVLVPSVLDHLLGIQGSYLPLAFGELRGRSDQNFIGFWVGPPPGEDSGAGAPGFSLLLSRFQNMRFDHLLKIRSWGYIVLFH